MGVMQGVISDLPADKRRLSMKGRLDTLAAMPDHQRKGHMEPMFEGLTTLTQGKRNLVIKAQIEAIATLPNENRSKIMKIWTS